MLIKQTGKCEKCGTEFGPMDTQQSTNVECSKCNKRITVCRSCKEKGCVCGGKLLDAWDKNPGMMF
jgi:DNA-directed RNA polymerase subunit RPC12/RpoP